jgi:integrase/recombinase XerD
MANELVIAGNPADTPIALFTPTPKAAKRVVEFFTGQINNDHTRRAYLNATRRFSDWCAAQRIEHLSAVQPFHVAAFLKQLQGEVSAPTVKQHLAALRHLFDWLVVGHILEHNPAHAVRGPKHVVRKGKTPVLTGEEARTLLDSIDTGSVIGLRDRALIGLMTYSFARVGAVLKMKVADYFIQGRRGHVRLHEKGGKEHEVPCHHKLEKYLDEYIAASGIAGEQAGPLFRTSTGRSGTLNARAMYQQDVFRMIRRRAGTAGIKTLIGNHTFRATGITAYLKNGGSLEMAQHIANHESPRTTKLYDRRVEEITLDEVERISL